MLDQGQQASKDEHTEQQDAVAGVPHVKILNPLRRLQEQEGWTLYHEKDKHLNLAGQTVLAAYPKEHLEVD